MMEPRTRYRICADVVCKPVGDGDKAILLNIDNGYYYVMNEVAMRIWDGIKQGETTGAIVTAIVDEFDVKSERAQDDLQKFATQLQDEGIVKAYQDGRDAAEEGMQG
jgi:hypothetical protein